MLSTVLVSLVGIWLWELVGPQIGDDQFWCIKGSSITHALLDMLHHWYLHTENMNISCVHFLDYSKTFDLLNHNCNILINELQMYGVPNIPLRWIGTFLSDRWQSVKVWGKHLWLAISKWLGPLLYMIMLNVRFSWPTVLLTNCAIDDHMHDLVTSSHPLAFLNAIFNL